MYDFPERILTDRLLLRPAMPGDGRKFHDAMLNSYDELKPWLGWVNSSLSLKEAEDTCCKAYGRYLLAQDLMIFLFDKENGELVGSIGLMNPNWDLRIFEIGYWCNTKFLKKGLMKEALSSVRNFSFQDMNAKRLYLTTDEKNISSWKLAESLGFQLEGTLRNDKLNNDGHLRNTRIYSIIDT